MTSRASQLLHDVLELPVDERAAVATELLASLEEAGPIDVHSIEAAWADEIERRARRVLSGESIGKPWEEVRRTIEANLEDLETRDTIRVLAVVHDRRRPGYWLSRL